MGVLILPSPTLAKRREPFYQLRFSTSLQLWVIFIWFELVRIIPGDPLTIQGTISWQF